MEANGDGERNAWNWICGLPRLDYRQVGFKALANEIIIRVCPGNLRYASSGAPAIRISVDYPDLGKRVVGTGNSLYDAVEQVQAELWRRGVKTPFVL